MSHLRFMLEIQRPCFLPMARMPFFALATPFLGFPGNQGCLLSRVHQSGLLFPLGEETCSLAVAVSSLPPALPGRVLLNNPPPAFFFLLKRMSLSPLVLQSPHPSPAPLGLVSQNVKPTGLSAHTHAETFS